MTLRSQSIGTSGDPCICGKARMVVTETGQECPECGLWCTYVPPEQRSQNNGASRDAMAKRIVKRLSRVAVSMTSIEATARALGPEWIGTANDLHQLAQKVESLRKHAKTRRL